MLFDMMLLLIELRKYKRMHVDISRARCSKCMRIYGLVRAGGGGGHVYEIRTLHSNLAPEERGGCLFEGGV